MNTQKIFLKQKEIETLCFSKIVQLPEKQTSIKKAKKYYAHAVEIQDDQIIRYQETIIILFSSVKIFEIPETEFNLFKNQFKIPVGLISRVKRKIYESHNVSGSFKSDFDISLDQFTPLRRALTQLLMYGYKNLSMQKHIDNFIKNFINISEFSKLFIKTVMKEKKYPELRIDTEGYHEDRYFMWIWWGKFIIDNVLEPDKTCLTETEISEHKKWFKSFNLDDLKKNHKSLKSIPNLYKENSSFIIGYFFATQTNTSTNSENVGDTIDEILNTIRDVDSEYDILFWGIFFQSFFIEEIDQIYPNPLIQNNFYAMESIALYMERIINGESKNFNFNHFKYDKINETNLVTNYFKLKEGQLKISPQILTIEKIFKPFMDSPLFKENRKHIGFINMDFDNSLKINNDSFIFKGKFSDGGMIYYGDLTIGQKDKLKKEGLNLKSKPINSLIQQHKKVLVAFLSGNSHYGKLENLYKEILNSNDKTRVKEIIVVWLVSIDTNELHSTKFALKKNEYSSSLEEFYGIKATIIVKNLNESNTGDSEVIRNLRIGLENYKVKEIEVIDKNFNDERAQWLIDATNDYIIKLNNVNYFSLLNI